MQGQSDRRIDPVGIDAPVDLNGTTPVGWAAVRTRYEHDDILHFYTTRFEYRYFLIHYLLICYYIHAIVSRLKVGRDLLFKVRKICFCIDVPRLSNSPIHFFPSKDS